MLIETVAGQLSTLSVQPSPIFVPHSSRDNYHDAREDFTPSDDDMTELSDSPSTRPSTSRPSTPLDIDNRPFDHRSTNKSAPSPTKPDEPLCLALKAGRILGLIPGTLPHAQACLEYAREEVKRIAEPTPISLSSSPLSSSTKARVNKMTKMGDVGMGHETTSSIVYISGEISQDDEERRERRRKAADSVIYWQREVQRLNTGAIRASSIHSSNYQSKTRRS